MDVETETAGPTADINEEIVNTLEEVSALLDDPVALLERAIELIRRRGEDDA